MIHLTDLSISIFGYNRSQVESVLTEKTTEINELTKTVEMLETNVKQLEEQLGHYHELEASLKAGIVDARLKGNEIIEDSSYRAEKIIKQTNEQVIQFKEELTHHSHELIDNGLDLRDSLNGMKKDIYKILEKYQNLLDETDFDKLYPANQVNRLSIQIEEYSRGEDALLTPTYDKLISESTLTEDEKEELEKLIHEVIANEASKENVPKAAESDKKLINFRTAKG